MTRVSVVIPCYRSAQTLPALVGRLLAVLPDVASAFEVVLVVDGSPDDTWEAAQELADRHETVRALLLARNYGQHNALVAGIRCVRYDVVVTMDDDLQHPPEEVPRLLAALRPDLDLVYAVPRSGTHGLLRDLASRSLKIGLSGRFGGENSGDICSFRAFRSFLREALDGVTGPYTQIDIAFSWATTRIGTVRVNMEHRSVGHSNYTVPMLVRHAIGVLVAYSSIPLRLVTYCGLLTGALGTVLLAVFLWSYWCGDTTVKGFTSTATMISLFASAQMVALGVIGEYLGRIHAERMGRPTYIIRERSESHGPGLSMTSDADGGHLSPPGGRHSRTLGPAR
ncbi:glycosyltransferase family 2 protein [Streptosporangium sandarakinum]|uniref:Undecaprenyl-phosphate 4-deoxy-4-formamido-L-arabinose transferase n=1 Tax=Streptosporangium sandarakinum TaxID=1260955 RepID=A0A852V688_9ACTN|nr:glycosyltransferase family 2 protein [Streptosporangium sandarakinum]NYF43646.1 undecaprenyl-phosphate 4-deoxy-4-formamido-L-arabinose transferase [Streptosporangium sandarakinum]